MEQHANALAADLEYVTKHVGTGWEALRSRTVFITGGTGFFGRWLLESFVHANDLHELGARAVVLSRNPQRFAAVAPVLARNPALTFVPGDIQNLNADALGSQLAGSTPHFDFMIHAATDASAKLNTVNPLLMIDTIVQGTRAALEFATRTGVKRFLLTSSGAVYGQQPPTLSHISEDYLGGPNPVSPASAYAEGKRLAELLCACFYRQHGLEPVIARCFAFVGPFLPLDTHFAMGNFIRDKLRGGAVIVGGDGTPYRSYLHAADLAVWLWTILVRGDACRPYNVGSEDGRPISAIARAVALAAEPASDVVITRTAVPGADASRYVPSTERARRELGLREQIDLSDAVQRTIRYLQASSGALRL